MKIDYLGHSEFVVTIQNSKWEDVRIMSDAWLSNYSFWDMMERNPLIKLDYSRFENLDAIFISHAHVDHFDPYTFVELYKNLKNRPTLLIPNTISYLTPLLDKYLPEQKYIILESKNEIDIKWIKIYPLVFDNTYITNEDDVMTIWIYNDKEVVYTEVDTLPSDTVEAQSVLYSLFTRKKFESVLYLSTRNELEWNLWMLDQMTMKDREHFINNYLETREWEIAWQYEKFDYEDYDFRDITKIKNFMRIFIWQWIVYPRCINSEIWQVKVLPLNELVKLEKKIAKNYWRTDFLMDFFEAWKAYEISKWNFKFLGDSEFISQIDFDKRTPNRSLEIFREFKWLPLNNEERDISKQEEIILDLLNNRFLAYYLWNTENNLKNVLLKEKDYIVKINYWFNNNYIVKYYRFWFNSFRFTQLENNPQNIYNEDYFANDLEDFYNWKQELYSNFLHKLEKWKSYRLWNVLWVNFLNNDLIYKKMELHFKRAVENKTVDEYVLKFYK